MVMFWARTFKRRRASGNEWRPRSSSGNGPRPELLVDERPKLGFEAGTLMYPTHRPPYEPAFRLHDTLAKSRQRLKRHLPRLSAPPWRRSRDGSMEKHWPVYNIVCGVFPKPGVREALRAYPGYRMPPIPTLKELFRANLRQNADPTTIHTCVNNR